MRKTLQMISIALCVTMLAAGFAGCNTKKTQMNLGHVDVYVAGDSKPLSDIGGNRVSSSDGVVRIDIVSDVKDVMIDLTKFFDKRDEYLGKNFYFTRDDVKKGDGTLVKGYAWVEVGKESGNRVYKKLGMHKKQEITPKTKGEIEMLPGREGEARLYILTSGDQAGKHVLYLDSTTGSNLAKGETRVTFRFHGHHGRAAELKVLVNKG